MKFELFHDSLLLLTFHIYPPLPTKLNHRPSNFSLYTLHSLTSPRSLPLSDQSPLPAESFLHSPSKHKAIRSDRLPIPRPIHRHHQHLSLIAYLIRTNRKAHQTILLVTDLRHQHRLAATAPTPPGGVSSQLGPLPIKAPERASTIPAKFANTNRELPSSEVRPSRIHRTEWEDTNHSTAPTIPGSPINETTPNPSVQSVRDYRSCIDRIRCGRGCSLG